MDCEGFILLKGLILPVENSRPFIVGRERSECTLTLSEGRVSKKHAVISFRDGKHFIRDLESLNGTYVNGNRIRSEMLLAPRDEIQIRPFSLLFIRADEPAIDTLVKDSSDQNKTMVASESDLSGRLDLIQIPDLISILNTNSMTGTLNINPSAKNSAQFVFHKGEIIKATCGKKSAEQAVYNALSIHSGHFVFTAGEKETTRDPIQSNTVAMLMEGTRVLDESTKKKQTKPIELDSANTQVISKL